MGVPRGGRERGTPGGRGASWGKPLSPEIAAARVCRLVRISAGQLGKKKGETDPGHRIGSRDISFALVESYARDSTASPASQR